MSGTGKDGLVINQTGGLGPVSGTHEERVQQVMREQFTVPVRPPPPAKRRVNPTNPHWYRSAKFYEVDEIPHLNALGRTDLKTDLHFTKHGKVETLQVPAMAVQAPQWAVTEHDYKPFARNPTLKPVNCQNLFTGQGFYPALSRPYMLDDEARIALKRLKESEYLRGVYYHADDLAKMKAKTKKTAPPTHGVFNRLGSVFAGARTDRYGFLLPMDSNIWDDKEGFARKDTHVNRMEFQREGPPSGSWDDQGYDAAADEEIHAMLEKHGLLPDWNTSPPKVVANVQPMSSVEYARNASISKRKAGRRR